MDVPLFGRIVDFERQKFALREHAIAVLVRYVALEAANHHLLELLRIRFDGARETLVVEKFEQRGEGFLVAVMWRRGEEEVVRAMGGYPLDGACAQARLRIVAAAARGDVVRLVNDKNVKFSRICDFGRQGFL